MVKITTSSSEYTGQTIGSIVRRVWGRNAKLISNADPNFRGWADVVGPVNPHTNGRPAYAQIYADPEAWATATDADFAE
jgi:hypothetical protein